jgi:hypothetical protein
MLQALRAIRDLFAFIGVLSSLLVILYFSRATLLQIWLNSLKAKDSFSLVVRQVYLSPNLERLIIGPGAIKNPPTYGGGDALVFSSIDVAFDSPMRWENRWNIKRARIIIERLNVVKRAHGDNVDELGILVKTFDVPRQLKHPFRAQEMNIILREIAFIDLSIPTAATSAAVNLQISDHNVDSYSRIYDSLMKLIAEIGRAG